MEYIKIVYKDKQDWTRELDGAVIPMTTLSTKFKEGRVQPAWVNPEVTIDTWNGKNIEVQHERWDSHSFQIFVKESEIHEINRIKSCDDITIYDYSKDDSGVIVNNTYVLDLTTSDMFQIDDPERAADTTGWIINITFRTNRTVINKALPVLKTNTVQISTDSFEFLSSNDADGGIDLIAALSEDSIVVYNSGIIQKWELNDGAWVKDGNTYNTGYTSELVDICALSNSTIAIIADTVDELSTLLFDGVDWTLSGNTLTLANSITSPKITSIDTYVIAKVDSEYKYIETYTFDGSDWTLTGAALALSATAVTTLALLSYDTDKVVYVNDVDSELITYTWNGSVWTNSYNDSITVGANIFLSYISTTNVALLDKDNGLLISYVTSGTAWTESFSTPVTGDPISVAGLGSNVIVIAKYNLVNSFSKLSEIAIADTVESITLIDDDLAVIIFLGTSNEVKVKAYTYDEVLDTWTQEGNEFDTGYTAVADYECKVVTLSTTAVALLFSDNDNPITPLYYGSVLVTLSWDGTDFAQVGNAYESMFIRIEASMCALSSSVVVAATYNGDSFTLLKALSWDGTDWTEEHSLNSYISWRAETKLATNGTNYFITIDYNSKRINQWYWSGSALSFVTYSPLDALDFFYHDVTSVAANTAQIVDVSLSSISNYVRADAGSTFLHENSSSITKSSQPNIAKFDDNKLIVAVDNELIIYELLSTLDNKLDNYDAGLKIFYSDFDILDYNKLEDPLKVQFPNRVEKIWKQVNKSGYSVLLFLSPEDYNLFIDSYKKYNNLYINGVEILELDVEDTEIGQNLIKLIINGVSEISPYVKNIAEDETYSLNMNTGSIIYYTDFPPVSSIRDVEKVNINWSDGTIKTLQVIRRLTQEIAIFAVDKQTIINDLFTYTDVKIGSTPLSEITTSVEELDIGSYKINVNGVTSVGVTTLYSFPTSGNHLIIDDGSSTYNYYTDFDLMLVSESPEISATKNLTGVNTKTKSISKNVYRATFYLSETNAFLLKKRFELFGTVTINTTPVLEAREVSPTKIGEDLYEVIVNCLTAATIL